MTQQCLSKHLSSPLSDSPTPTFPEIHLCPFSFYPFEQDRWIVIDRERGLTPSSSWHAAVAIILSTFSLISRAHPQEVGVERRGDEWQAECTPRGRGMGKRRTWEQPRDPTVTASCVHRRFFSRALPSYS